MHTARIWMALAIPGGAPGYDYDKEFGNNITHSRSQTSQRLRGLYRPAPGSQGKDAFSAITASVAGFRRFGECEFAVPAMRWGAQTSVRSPDEAQRNPGISPAVPDYAALHPGYENRASTHPLAASGATHSNSGS